AIEQHRALDRELGGPCVEPVAVGRCGGGEIDERGDRSVELGGGVVAIERGGGDLGEHRVGLGGGLASGQRGAAQAVPRVVAAAERDQRARQRELVASGGRLAESDAAQLLVQRRGGGVVVAGGGGGGQPDHGVGLHRIELECAAPRVLGGAGLRRARR